MAQSRSILITGCSSGIGLDAARGLRDRGWQVFGTTRTAEDSARLEGEGITSPILDYTDPDSITAALSQVLGLTGGTLDAVFNNGAHGLPGAVEDLPRDALRAIFEANVLGVHDLTRQVIPVMRAQGHGRIVQCSSVLGYVTYPWRGAYVATKYALEGLTDTLRIEMRDTPIHVVLIEPGPITSRIRQNAIPHFERWIDWEASPRAEQYRAGLLKRLYEDRGKDRFELSPSAVTAKLIRALESPNPRARYRVTVPAQISAIARRLLPTRATDWIISKG